MNEVELKFAVEARSRPQLARASALGDAQPVRTRMTSIYFDTPDGELARAGMALRLRQDGARWAQTLKSRGTATGGLHARDEWEFDCDAAVLDLARFRETPLAGLPSPATLHRRLRAAFEVRFERTRWEVRPAPGCALEVALDRGRVLAGARSEEISELEIECREGGAACAFDLAERLLEEVTLRPSAVSKAQRGYALLAGRGARPVKAKPVRLDAGMTPQQAARTVIAAGLEQLLANEEGILRSHDAELVHQARVALRRTRSALRMFRDVIGEERAAAWRGHLGEVARALGVARDWDVFATVTLPAAAAAYRDTGLGAALAAHAEMRRRREHEAARRALRSREHARVILQLGGWITRAEAEPRKPGEEALADFASRLLRKRHKRLLAGALQLGTLSVEERHRVRIDAKRLRYGIDGLASLFKPARVRPFGRCLADLQDALGEANDAATGLRLLADLDPPAAFAEFARGWLTARARGDAAVLEPLVAQLASQRRFWRKPARRRHAP